jgi:predicted DCC family thiol-disulfide oxidoreductase YuxK
MPPTVAQPMLLVFDGQCTLCQRGSRRLERLAARGAIVRIDRHDPRAPGAIPALTPAILEQSAGEIKLFDPATNTWFGGVPAIARALDTRRGWRAVTWLHAVPGLRQTLDAAYRLLARNRLRVSSLLRPACADGVCDTRIHEAPGPKHP